MVAAPQPGFVWINDEGISFSVEMIDTASLDDPGILGEEMSAEEWAEFVAECCLHLAA